MSKVSSQGLRQKCPERKLEPPSSVAVFTELPSGWQLPKLQTDLPQEMLQGFPKNYAIS
jgi:hypothetical protein